MRIPATLTKVDRVKKSWRDQDDPQAHRVYLMERKFIGWNVLTQHSTEYLESVVNNACRIWKVPAPRLDVSSKKNNECYGICYGDRIWLNSYEDRPGNNLGVLVHELAHWIADRVYSDQLPGHSPEFVYVYGRLLDQYKMFPFDLFQQLCKQFKVKIAEGD